MSHPFLIIELKADFSLDDCIDFINSVTDKGNKIFRNLFVALPFFRLREITEAFPSSGITFGTALLNNADPGSFSAPVAGKMVKDARGEFALIGTGYERNRLLLTREQLENKLQEAKRAGLKTVYAVGGGLEIDENTLIEQLETLKRSGAIDDDPHPALIYELPFHNFQSYLPSESELKTARDFVQRGVEKVFGQKFALLALLPSDLMGFSSLIDSLPFDGAFFIKSGTYPHAIHNETVKLVHVHCEEKN